MSTNVISSWHVSHLTHIIRHIIPHIIHSSHTFSILDHLPRASGNIT